jgi:hypothetical protein
VSNNEDGLYVTNLVHVLLETGNPKQLLIVDLFDQDNEEDRVLGNGIRVQMIAFGFDV